MNKPITEALEDYLTGADNSTPEEADLAQNAVYFLFRTQKTLMNHDILELTPDDEEELDHELLRVVARFLDEKGVLPQLEKEAQAAASAKADADAATDRLAAAEQAEWDDEYEESQEESS
jgi:ribosomal protein L12E/L44/L45/RPP1/RPP2